MSYRGITQNEILAKGFGWVEFDGGSMFFVYNPWSAIAAQSVVIVSSINDAWVITMVACDIDKPTVCKKKGV